MLHRSNHDPDDRPGGGPATPAAVNPAAAGAAAAAIAKIEAEIATANASQLPQLAYALAALARLARPADDRDEETWADEATLQEILRTDERAAVAWRAAARANVQASEEITRAMRARAKATKRRCPPDSATARGDESAPAGKVRTHGTRKDTNAQPGAPAPPPRPIPAGEGARGKNPPPPLGEPPEGVTTTPQREDAKP